MYAGPLVANLSNHSSVMFSEPLQGLCCRCHYGGWAPHGHSFSVFWPVVDLSNDFHMLHTGASLIRRENYPFLKNNLLRPICPAHICSLVSGHPQEHNQPEVMGLKKMDCPSLSLSTAPRWDSWTPPHSLLECWLAWSCANSHSFCEYECRVVVLPCPEDAVWLWFSPRLQLSQSLHLLLLSDLWTLSGSVVSCVICGSTLHFTVGPVVSFCIQPPSPGRKPSLLRLGKLRWPMRREISLQRTVWCGITVAGSLWCLWAPQLQLGQIYRTTYVFPSVEQTLNPIRKGLVTPLTLMP